jgi:hypothetical protein
MTKIERKGVTKIAIVPTATLKKSAISMSVAQNSDSLCAFLAFIEDFRHLALKCFAPAFKRRAIFELFDQKFEKLG